MRLAILLLLTPVVLICMLPGTWETYADANYSYCVCSHDDILYVGTRGGVIVYNCSDGGQRIMTNLDGLGGLEVVALEEYDGDLYYASSNGALGRLFGGEWFTYSELARSNINVNDLISSSYGLYIATVNGISKLNVLDGSDPLEVAENYTKLGDFERNLPVLALSADDSMIWAGTENGIASAKFGDNLFIPEAWNILETDRPVTAVIADSGGVWLSLEQEDDSYSIFWTDGVSIDTIADPYMLSRFIDGFFYYNGELYASGRSGLFVYKGPGDFDRINIDEHWAAHDGTVYNDSLYVGLEIGFGILRDDMIHSIRPNCPVGTGFIDVDFGPDGDVWIVSKDRGICRYDDGIWEVFDYSTLVPADSLDSLTIELREYIYSAYVVEIGSDGAIWIGTNSDGIFRLHNDGQWEIFDENNSILSGVPGGESTVLCRALAYDNDLGKMWVSNYAGSGALAAAAFDPTGGLNSPDVIYHSGLIGIPVNYIHGMAAGLNRLWLVIKDEGITMIDVGYSLDETDDDYIRSYKNELPSASAFQVELDSYGRAWVAVEGGVTEIDPGVDLVVNHQLPEHISLGVSDVSVDSWDNVWVSTDDGAAIYRSADSSWLGIKTQYSTNAYAEERSDLVTDYLYSVGVNPINGDVWFCGEGGISVLHTGFFDPDSAIEDLVAYPNPFLWDGRSNTKAIINNVPPDADLNIYSADGSLVRRILLEQRGFSATVSWDGRNGYGEPVASGIYFLVAVSESGVSRGKIALIREY